MSMPELPEVETLRRQLEPVLVGQQILSVEVLRDKSWFGDVRETEGRKIASVERKGKVLIVGLKAEKSKETFLIVHLKMTGQLIYQGVSKKTEKVEISLKDRIVGGHPNNSWTSVLPDKHTRVIINLSKGSLFFNDQRVFGWVKLITGSELKVQIAKMPPDIIDIEVTEEWFFDLLQRSGRAIKLVIMDSGKLGGVGNIYANDGLFDAGIDPRRSSKSLTRKESNRLLASLKKVVNLGIKLGGATAADGKFVNSAGLGGTYQNHFLVYEQEGKVVSLNKESGVVQKIKLGGRGTYWVPELQK